MKQHLMKHILLYGCIVASPMVGYSDTISKMDDGSEQNIKAQTKKVTVTVVDPSDSPMPGVNVLIKGTSTGGITDFNGQLTLDVDDGAVLVLSFISYKKQEITVGASSTLSVTMEEDTEKLDEVVVVGSRNAPRSYTDTPLPVDKIDANELLSLGQPSFDKALMYKVPSFNTVQTPVNDATSLLDPYEIRNLGPSRTLILVNGKRKNLSALLYTQTSPGKGETGADLSAIPTNAIKRVEVLRDGASAQYGSDAIAGVVNIVLKDDVDAGSVTFNTGITGEGDGERYGLVLNNGNTLGKGKGFVNYTLDFSKEEVANRPGTVNAEGEAADFGADIDDVRAFLAMKPDAGNINGTPESTAMKFLMNAGYDLNANSSIYANAAYVYKKVESFANYRTPYWRTESDFPYLADFFPNGPNGEYIGYLPTFIGDLSDYNATVGFKSKKNDWIYDGSLTVGGNKQVYTVGNTHNRNTGGVTSDPVYLGDLNNNGQVDPDEIQAGDLLYQDESQLSFQPGGTQFSHVVGNIDISKVINSQLGVAFGSEIRSETFEIIPGELASYDGGGGDSFSGNDPANSGIFNRYNIGGYLDLVYDVNKDWMINGTARYENYSDFGDAFVWKVSSRYLIADELATIRGSVSTGFRAPTLHQIYTQKAQYSFVPGEGIQVGGLVNNVSREARLLGLDNLKAEESLNFTVGLGSKLNDQVSLTIDYYNIAIEDRILLSSEIVGLPIPNVSNVSFFVNAIDTRTSGLDFVFSYRDVPLGAGKLGFNLSGNYVIENERDGDIKEPEVVRQLGQSVLDRAQEALFFTSRPETKWILGADYRLKGLQVALNNTYFGKSTFMQAGLDENLKTEFIPKVVTDLSISYDVTDKLNVTGNVNNIFNVLPEWKFVALNETGQGLLDDPVAKQNQSNLITFNQRYSQMTYDGSHFSQLGTIYNLSVRVTF